MGKLKLTSQLILEMCELKKKGLTHRAVCGGVGISETAFFRWIGIGEKAVESGKDNVYGQFFREYKKAEAVHKMVLLEKIHVASEEKGTWQAAAWELERCYPREYGKRTLEVTGAEGAAIQAEIDLKGQVEMKVDLGKLSLEELEKLDGIAEKVTNSEGTDEESCEFEGGNRL